jgi:hypothetical protein
MKVEGTICTSVVGCRQERMDENQRVKSTRRFLVRDVNE